MAPMLGIGLGPEFQRSKVLGSAAPLTAGWGGNALAPLWAPHTVYPDQGSSGAVAGLSYYGNRNPITVKTGSTILSFCLGMESGIQDYQSSTIWCRASSDRGVTWSVPREAYRLPSYASGTKFIYFGSAVTHTATGRVHLIFIVNSNGTTGVTNAATDTAVWTTYSDDLGVTWSAAANISTTAKQLTNATPVPADFATPLLAGYGSTNGPWWYMAGHSHGICLQLGAKAGRLIIPMTHRYTATTAGTSYQHTIVSDDNGVSWKLGGGLLEATAGNADANENSICECSDQSLYMTLRRVGNSSTTWRYSAVSTDQGLTWFSNAAHSSTAMVLNDGNNSTSNLISVNTSGSVVSMPNGDLFLSIVNDSLMRANLTMLKSTDNGATWGSSKVLYDGPCGYSSLCVIDSSTLLSIFEASRNPVDNAISGAFEGPYQSIQCAVWNRTWFAATGDKVYDWQFNEQTSGPTITTGTTLIDIGKYGVCGQGSAAASYTANGLSFSGSGAGPILNFRCWDQITNVSVIGGALDLGHTTLSTSAATPDSSITFEFDLTYPNGGGDSILFASKAIGIASPGFAVEIVSGKIKFTARKSSLKSAIITGGTSVNDGVRRVVSCVWDIVNNKVFLYLDGVSDATAVTSTGALNLVTIFNTVINKYLGSCPAATIAITAGTGNGVSPIVITGANHGLLTGSSVTIASVTGNTAANGTFTITVVSSSTFSLNGTTGNGTYGGSPTCTATLPPLPANTLVNRVRITKAALASGFLATTTPKTSLGTFFGYTQTLPANDPTSITGCQLWLGAEYDGGFHCGVDMQGGGDTPRLPVGRGQGFSTYRDIVGNKVFNAGGSFSRGMWWDYDSVVGWHVRHTFFDQSANGCYKAVAGAISAYDFIQNTCTFSVAMAFKLNSNTGAFQGLFCTSAASSSNPGIDLFYDTGANQIYLQIENGSGHRFTEEFTNDTLSLNAWYFVGIVGNGANTNKVDLYYGLYPGSLASVTLSHRQSTSSITGGTLAVPATQPLLVGARTTSASAADLRSKNILLYNTALSAGNMQTLADFNVVPRHA